MQINQLPSASSLNLQDKFAVDATDGVTKSITASQLRDLIRTNSYGAPLEANTVAAMTDTSKVYVYTGNETGYTNGNWYYYNGTAWVSGGVYNSVAVNTDTTLSLHNVAADAWAVGEADARLSADIIALDGTLSDQIQDIFINTATDYDSLSFPVSKGQYCLHANNLFKARQDIPTIEAWNIAHWEQVNIGDELYGVVDDIKTADETKNAISMYTLSWGPGGLYSATGIEYASANVSRTPFIPIQPGTTFYYESQDTSLPFTIYEFATNETTTASVNNRLVLSDQSYNKRRFYKVSDNTYYIRFQSGVNVNTVKGNFCVLNATSPYANVIAHFTPTYVTPEMFARQTLTDVQTIQSAVNYAFENKCDVVFPRMYTLNSNEYIYLNKYSGIPDTNSRFATRFIGINGGGITKRATGHIFTANSSYVYSGDLQFIGLNFESDSGAGCNVFNLNALMRMVVENCFFKNVDSVARNDYVPNDTRTYYCQDITYRNCTIVGGTGYAFHSRGCYAVTFDGLTIEHRDGGIRLGVNTNDNYYTRCRNLVIQNCVIEGISGENIRTVEDGTPTNGWAINIQNPIQVLIQGCYFEQNYGNILLRNASTGSFYSADVRDCLLSGTFPVERYGNATVYRDIMDNSYLVTLGGNAGDYQIEKCVSQFGGILNVGTSISGVILYLANNYNPNSTGSITYSSYTYNASSGTWKGSNGQVDSTTITGNNNGMSQCKTYQIVSLT